MQKRNGDILRIRTVTHLAGEKDKKKYYPVTVCNSCMNKVARGEQRPYCWKHSPYVLALIATVEFQKELKTMGKKYSVQRQQ